MTRWEQRTCLFNLPAPELDVVANAVLFSVPDALLAEYGLRRGSVAAPSYPCGEVEAVLIPLCDIRGPVIEPRRRGYQLQRLRPVLAAIAAGQPLPAVPVYRDPGTRLAVLLDGAHRFGVSLALGYRDIPCRLVSLEEAETMYRYPDGQC